VLCSAVAIAAVASCAPHTAPVPERADPASAEPKPAVVSAQPAPFAPPPSAADASAAEAPGIQPPRHCTLVLRAQLVRENRVRYGLTGIAENRTDAPLSFTLPDRCPQGELDFTGLPAGYDYYRWCTKGACAGPRRPLAFQLAPREKRVIVATTLSVDGSAPCSIALQPKLYSIKPVAKSLPATTCFEAAELDLRNP
jgi:hypothetical protein